MENLITIITFTLPQDAYLAKGFLESEGLETYIKDELTAQVNNFYSNAIGGVKLQVNENDYENGIRLLQKGGFINFDDKKDEIKLEIVHLDKSSNKKICPFCKSDNIAKKKEPNIITLILLIFSIFFPIFKRSYICYDCNKAWKYKK
ncbi:MAG: DUF2007 domain-containing protein [bacterium]